MGTADQRFNVDVAFLYGSIWATRQSVGVELVGDIYVPRIVDFRVPNWSEASTDWNRRVTTLPSLTKSVENWTGKFEVTDLEFDLYDGDQGVYATLYATGVPFGKNVMMLAKVIDNPQYFMPVFVGAITGVRRSKRLTSITLEDGLRNLHNSQFTPDYFCFATTIGGTTYGTVVDIVGTNVYIEDLGKVTLIEREVKGQDSDWMTAVIGGIFGGVAAAVSGGGIAALAVGVGGGFLSGIPTSGGGGYKQRWYQAEDFNAIPDGLIFGGQPLKFHVGSFDGRASGVNGSMYSVPSYTIHGGTFIYGIHGTFEIDDLFSGVRRGDYIYAELPLVYYGSPDDVIIQMLTGSNVSVQYRYPDDFATNWTALTETLKHIECWKVVDNFEPGGVANAISELCSEFGFTFYINESNRFTVRTIRETDLDDPTIIGTLDERYNVLNDGFSRTDELKTSYTDIRLRFKNTRIGENYNQEIRATTYGATYFGGGRRVLEVDSQWIHDLLTGEFMATRLMRRWATVIPRIECDVSLYSVPVELGEFVKCTGWAVGTSRTHEIIGYSKDFNSNICKLTLEDAEPVYRYQRFFYFATVGGTVFPGCKSGWATILATIAGTFGWSGTLKDNISNAQSSLETFHLVTHGNDDFNVIGSFSSLEGRYFRVGTLGEEIMYAYGRLQRATSINGTDYQTNTYKIDRGCFDTQVAEYSLNEMIVLTSEPTATVYSAGTQYGTYMRWF